MSLPQYFDAATYGDKAQAMNDLATKKMQEMYGTAGDAMSRRDTRRFNRWMRKEGVDQIEREMINPTAPATPANTEKQSFIPTQEQYIKQQYGENASRRDIRRVRRNWDNTVVDLYNLGINGLVSEMKALKASQAEQANSGAGAGSTPAAGAPAAGNTPGGATGAKPAWTPTNAEIGQGATTYKVQERNTLGQIADAYNKANNANITWQQIADQLKLSRPEDLQIGSIIDFSKLVTPAARKGGSIKRHQQGGQVSPEQQELQFALMGYIVATKKQPKDENEIQMIAQQLVQLKQQDPLQYSQLVQLGQQAQALKAEKGAKLNYIKSLKGQCPDGEELVYFKKGGMIDCGCQKKEKGGEVKQPKKANAIEEFKKGRKTKKC